MESQLQLPPPWLSIWTHPRQTIRQIIDIDPTEHILLLAALVGINQTLSRLSLRNAGDDISLVSILSIAAIAGSIGGVISLYIVSAILRWTGRLLGGTASSEDVRAAVAWSGVPMIALLILFAPQLLIFGEEMFTSAMPRVDASLFLLMLLMGFGIIEVIIAVWGLVILVNCLAEAQQFSAWRALGSVLIPGSVIMFATVVIIVGLALLGGILA